MTDQDRARRQRYRVRRRAVGGCVSCAQPALPGRTRCETHAAKHRLSAGPAKKGYQAVTREQVLADVQAVAQRLHVRIVTTRLYQREGSFCLTSPLRRRIGSWSALCVEAGLLPTYRGCRGDRPEAVQALWQDLCLVRARATLVPRLSGHCPDTDE